MCICQLSCQLSLYIRLLRTEWNRYCFLIWWTVTYTYPNILLWLITKTLTSFQSFNLDLIILLHLLWKEDVKMLWMRERIFLKSSNELNQWTNRLITKPKYSLTKKKKLYLPVPGICLLLPPSPLKPQIRVFEESFSKMAIARLLSPKSTPQFNNRGDNT